MTQIQLRRGSSGQWSAADPVLANGEPGFEDDTGLLKIGDGTTDWIGLPYQGGGAVRQSLNIVEDDTNFTAAENELSYIVADPGGGIVVSLPPTPADGTINTIVAATDTVVLDGNGNVIWNGVGSPDLEFQIGTVATVRWDANDSLWLVMLTASIGGQTDLGLVTLVAQNTTQGVNYGITDVMPGWIPSQGIWTSQAPPNAQDWTPLQAVASGDVIQVLFSTTLDNNIWDSVDFGFEMVVWDLTGENLISVVGGGFTPGPGSATPGEAQTITEQQLIGTALSVTDDQLSVTVNADGVYNVMLKSGAQWN